MESDSKGFNTIKNRTFKPECSTEGEATSGQKTLLNDDKPVVEVEEPLQLKRQLGIIYGTSVITGIMIGGGIYITPPHVLKHAKSPGMTLIVWALAGLHALFGSFVSAEMGLRYPTSGETYNYLCQLYSPWVGLIYSWQFQAFLRPASSSIKVIMLGNYLLKPFFADCQIPPMAVNLIASMVATCVVALNCISVKHAARGQTVLITITILVLTCFSFIGLYNVMAGSAEILKEPFQGSEELSASDLISAFFIAVFTFSGWSALNFIIEEVKNPKRTLPAAIFLSCAIVTVLYLLVNMSYLVILGKEEMLQSEAVAVSMAIKMIGPAGIIMSIFIAITACSSFNSALMIGSRVLFAAARNNHVPICMSFISITFSTPIMAVLMQGFMSLFYIWLMETENVIKNVTLTFVFWDAMVVFGYLRARTMDSSSESYDLKDRRFKLPLFVPATYSIFLTFLLLVSLFTNFLQSVFLFLILASFPVLYYVVFVFWLPRYPWVGRKYSMINLLIQKLLYCAPGEI